MSALVNEVVARMYQDSVALMRVSVELEARPDVLRAAVMMATPENLAILDQADLLSADISPAPNDLLVAVRGDDERSAREAVASVQHLLENLQSNTATPHEAGAVRTFGAALNRLPDANLALISVPGVFAAAEAEQALDAGLDVMLFSDNVDLDDEVRLKRLARERGRLLMGPDCGTAIIGGVPLGFANAVERGGIGIVSASGTGLQELSVLLSSAGVGISHGIGVGGRDLHAEVGGISTLTAIEWLAEDEVTERIVVISKPPDEIVAEKVLDALAAAGKPAVACFLGAATAKRSRPDGVSVCTQLIGTLEHLLQRSFERVDEEELVRLEVKGGGRVQGLYAGGTLCAEAQSVFLDAGVPVTSNAPVPGVTIGGQNAAGHVLLDLGADEFTRGRPHPMLEPSVRDAVLLQALRDPQTSVVLVDVVLGFGAHENPAASVARVVNDNPGTVVIASLCGTDQDPQNAARQRAQLEDAGVRVYASAARAATVALKLARSVTT